MLDRIQKAYHRIVLDHPWWVIVPILILLVLAATQVRHFHLDASAESLMLEGDEDMHYYREIRARYGSDDFLIVTWTPEAPLFEEATLDRLQQLRDELEQLEQVSGVMSILDVPLLDSPRVSLGDLETGLRTLRDEGTDRDMAREEFRSSPLYRDLLMNQDADTTAILVTLQRDEQAHKLLQRRDELRIQQADEGLDAEQAAELEDVTARYRERSRELQADLEATIADVRGILAEHRDFATIHLGGVPMIAVDMIDFVRGDIRSFGIGVALFILALLAATFQRLRWVIVPSAIAGSVALLMTGFLGFAAWPVTVVSSNFISLVLIITLSLMVHLVVRHRELHMQSPEASGRELMRETVYSKFKPSLYTAITTIIAFGAMVFADIRPVIDFGLMMVCAVTLAFLLTFTLFPSLLAGLSPGAVPKFRRDVTARFNRKVASGVDSHPLMISMVFFVLVAVSAIGVSRVTVENRFIDYFKPDTEIYQGMELIDRELGGTTPLDVVLDPSKAYLDHGSDELLSEAPSDETSTEDAVADDEPRTDEATDDEWGDDDWGDDDWNGGGDEWAADWDDDYDADHEAGPVGGYWFNEYQVEVMGDIHDYLESLPETGKVLSVATSLRLVQMLNNDRPLSSFEMGVMFERLPEDLREILFDPYMSDDGDQIRIDIRIVDSAPNLERDVLLKQINEALMEKFDLAPEQVRLTGMLVLYNNVMQSLVRSQFITLFVVFAAMMLMFAFLFRSLKMAVIGPLPTLVASIGVIGLIGWVGLPLDIMTMTIAAITIGIGVHDTIHYTHRFKGEVDRGQSYGEALRESHVQVGRAMVYTTVIIIAGFSILTLSNFMPTIYFGLLTGVAMAFALISNLFLLPVLLQKMKPF